MGVLRSLNHNRTVRVAIMAHDDRLASGEDLPAPPEMIARHQESVARADSMVAAVNARVEGASAFFGGYRYERVIDGEDADLVVPPDGGVGNALFRSLFYLGGAEMLRLKVLGPRPIFGNSSYNKRFAWPAKFIAGLM